MNEPSNVPTPARPNWIVRNMGWIVLVALLAVGFCCFAATVGYLVWNNTDMTQVLDQSTARPIQPTNAPVQQPTAMPRPTDQPARLTEFTIFVDGQSVTLRADTNGGFYYETGIGVTQGLSFTLPEGYAFALDADDSMGTCPRNALDDVLIFGDQSGKYTLWGSSSAGLYIAPQGEAPDLAGPAIRNRASAASNWQWPRPTYWYDVVNDKLVPVTVDPFGQ